MARRLLCCTDNLSVLPVCGVFLSLLGIVLFILFLVAEGLTTSLEYINASLPVWVPAVLLLVTGIAVILLSKKRPVGLLVITLCLSIASAVVCISITVPTIINTIPLMESLTLCVYQQSMAECRCYVIDSKHNGTNLISIPEGSQQYTFKEVKGCDSIEHTLKDIVFTECVIYCFGALACFVATILTSMLLCNERKSNKSPVQHINSDAFDNPNSHRFHYNNGSRLFLNGPGQTYIVGLQGQDQDRRALINSEVVATEERTSTVTNTTNTTTAARGTFSLPGYAQSRNAPQRTTHVRRSSSSSSAAVPRPVPSNSRHHSISTADVAGLGTRNTRSSRPPPLVRGGFMQSRPDGRAVPVYTIPGSNQAYISLNDLPSLQMPNMNSVPAYVPRATSLDAMQCPYPNEQPPPYSPSAEYPNGEVPPFTSTALTTVNETSESALSSPVRNTADVNTPVPVDNSSVQNSPDVTASDENMEVPADNSDRLLQERINETLLNENFTFSNSGSNQSPRSLQDLASVTHSSDGDYDLNNLTEPRQSEVRTHNITVGHSEPREVSIEGQTPHSHMGNQETSSKDDDYDLNNLTESRQPETNNLSVEDLDNIEVSLEGLTPASQHKWNQGTSSRESLVASLASLAPELGSGTSRRLSDDNKSTEILSGIGESSVESISNKRLPMGARPKVKPKPGKQKKKKKISEIKATSTSRLDGESSFISSMNNNPVTIGNIGVDDTNFRSKTTSMPDLSRPSSIADDDDERFERSYDDSTNKTEMSKTSSSNPKLWAFDVGTIDGRRKKNTHRNTTAFYDLIERANNYQRKDMEKSSQGNQRKQEHKKRSKNTQNPEYNINHTNPRQKAKIRTDLPASSAWGSKKNIPSISGRAAKPKNRPQLIESENADTYKMGLSSSSNESLTGVINLVANTATSSTRARKKRVLKEAQSITELLDTRV